MVNLKDIVKEARDIFPSNNTIMEEIQHMSKEDLIGLRKEMEETISFLQFRERDIINEINFR